MEQLQEELFYGPVVTEVWDLLQGQAPNRLLDPDIFGPYRELIEKLWEVYDDAQQLLEMSIVGKSNGKFAGLDFDDPTTAVVKQWAVMRDMRAYAPINVMLTMAGKLRPDRKPLGGLPAILALIQQSGSTTDIKVLLHQIADDVGQLSAAELLSLSDMLHDQFSIPNAWINEFKRTLKNGVQHGNQNGTQNGTASNGVPPVAPASANSVITFLNSANMTDTGNAECLAYLYGDFLRFCRGFSKEKRWLTWSGQRWQTDPGDQVERFAVLTLRQRYSAAQYAGGQDHAVKLAKWALMSENVKGTNAMLEKASRAKPFLIDSILDLDAHAMLAGVPNGTLDLETGTLRESRREDYLTMQLGTPFDAAADCPRWKQFLVEIFNGDTDLIAFIQRAIGYTLTGDTREQCVFFCFGEGSNGKGVLFNTMAALLGNHAKTAEFGAFDADYRAGVGEYLAALRTARLVLLTETEDQKRLSEAKVKAISAGDPITCRHLFSEPFTYRPRFKIWLSTNHKPIIRNVDHAIWRRIRLIPFNRIFSGAAVDKTLETKLFTELPGILNWALAGLQDWLANGLGTCSAIEAATNEYRKDSDVVQQWIDDNLIVDPGTRDITDPDTWIHEPGTLIAIQGYSDFKAWAKERGWEMSHTAWGTIMKSKGYEAKRMRVKALGGGSTNPTVYLGIRFRTTND